MKRAIVGILLATGALSWAQSQSPARAAELGDVKIWLETWPDRERELTKLKSTPLDELSRESRLQAISWLKQESEFSQIYADETGDSMGEGYGEYYIDLTLFVVTLKDATAIPALAKAMQVGEIVSTTLAEFGDIAVDPVIAETKNRGLLMSGVRTLGRFIEAHQAGETHLSLDALQKIKTELLRETANPSVPVRQTSVEALQYFGNDTEITAALRKIANSDASGRARTVDGRREVVYPVREAARRILRKLGESE